ncbi:hypothetical protein [Parachitinimonas caeni]|uniref:3-oxoacyl-[acyl-carrier-protein] synthase-1 n=1 Tax=Parachitinimonas caeni TaxID=3031301 RepID=A0ABT7DTG6_9NEIS|nr:hypothetical protein [Parachitinimonas caeni]MDK2123363.1 hypothetical protein [Parachitinimonas caeni]
MDQSASPSNPIPTARALPLAPLSIAAAGLCCAVGHSLAAASAAIRAGMDHFQESQYVTQEGYRLLTARLPDDTLWGKARLARWISLAIADCLRGLAVLDTRQIPVIWLAPEQERAGYDADWYREAFDLALHQLQASFHTHSGVLPHGRAGLAPALQQAANWIASGEVQQVLLVGADSLLEAPTINAYLQAHRLQAPGNVDGFIPGEAAAALLLTTASLAPTGLVLCGAGMALEPGRIDGSVPSRAQGLSAAIRAALAAANLDFAALDFRFSDQNGESFYAKEAANALSRVTPVHGHQLRLMTLADCLGEVGAATGPAMLAYLHSLRQKRGHYRPPLGPTGLLHLANDNGLRSAVVVEYPADLPE